MRRTIPRLAQCSPIDSTVGSTVWRAKLDSNSRYGSAAASRGTCRTFLPQHPARDEIQGKTAQQGKHGNDGPDPYREFESRLLSEKREVFQQTRWRCCQSNANLSLTAAAKRLAHRPPPLACI